MKFPNFVLFFLVFQLAVANMVNLHFFIEPKFNPEQLDNIITVVQEYTYNDSIPFYHFYCGAIFHQNHSDEELMSFLNALNGSFIAPVDYHFSANEKIDAFTLLSSNIQLTDYPLNQYEIIKTDSLKIGIITMNTPDQLVKNKINGVSFHYDFFNLTRQLATELQKKTDFIILLSSLSKEIDGDITLNTPIDVVVSFDYQSRPNGRLSNAKTYWYSTKAHRGTMGTLQVRYQNGNVSHKWLETKVEFE